MHVSGDKHFKITEKGIDPSKPGEWAVEEEFQKRLEPPMGGQPVVFTNVKTMEHCISNQAHILGFAVTYHNTQAHYNLFRPNKCLRVSCNVREPPEQRFSRYNQWISGLALRDAFGFGSDEQEEEDESARAKKRRRTNRQQAMYVGWHSDCELSYGRPTGWYQRHRFKEEHPYWEHSGDGASLPAKVPSHLEKRERKESQERWQR